MIRVSSVLVLSLASSAALAPTACSDECGPGYDLEGTSCRARDATGGAGGGPDPGAAGAPEAGAPSCPSSTFGNACRSEAECTCDTDFCAGYPGQGGICTHTGCLDDPEVCPAGWGCMDLSGFGAGLPAICTPP